MSQPKLSICIPTYNRADHIKQSLENISKQLTNQTELVISNNDSTDNTKIVVEEFIQQYPDLNIRLNNQTKNIGFDKNVLSVVAHAEGEYCWLLSDDDKITDGAVKNILEILEKQPNLNLLLVNYSRFDEAKQKVTAEKMINLPEDIICSDYNDFYFTEVPNSYFYILGTNMITMSVNVFNRQHWHNVVPRVKRYIGLNFIHIFVLTSTMAEYNNFYFSTKPHLQYLQNNHRNWENDIWQDYKKHFLGHLEHIGFDKNRVSQIKNRRMNRLTPKQYLYRFLVAVLGQKTVNALTKRS